MTARIFVWLMLASTVVAQQRATLPSGNARISGRVVAADSGAPLAGARVTLEASHLPSSMARTVRTDANGTFEFPEIAAGTYGLKADKAGYFTKPSSRFRIAGDTPVSVRDGQTADTVMIALHRGGAITGRLVGQSGQPVPQLQVHAHRLQHGFSAGERAPGIGGLGDLTDDLGQFRVYGLRPGDYIIVASGRNSTGLPGILDLSNRDDPAPVYYPGTGNSGEAQIVSLGPGEETSVHFTYAPVPLVQVSGIALMSDGRPAAGMRVSLRAGTPGFLSLRGGGGTVSNDGTFRIARVSPGQYWVDVANEARTPAAERGSAAVSIGREDVTGVSIVTAPGVRVSGTVIFESTFSQRGTFQLSAFRPGFRFSPWRDRVESGRC